MDMVKSKKSIQKLISIHKFLWLK